MAYQVGDKALGGVIAEVRSDSYLVAQEADISSGAEWGCYGTELGASSNTDGYSNTQTIVNNCGDSGIAAKLCWNDNTNGYIDWYLPAKNELDVLYQNRNDIGGFSSDFYWSSSESSSYYACSQYFGGGGQYDRSKFNDYRVRAVRIDPISEPPDTPTNPSPSHGTMGVATDTTLSVDVSDPDGNSIDVSFYWDDGTLIETVTGVASGNTATTSSLSLSEATTHSWYVVADNGHMVRQSPTWSFYPAIGKKATLSVDVSDPDGDSMDVSFYDASSNDLLGIVKGVSSGNTASLERYGLYNNNSYSWYAVADDGKGSIQSPTWSFTTENNPPDKPSNVSPSDGATKVSIDTSLSLDVSDPDGENLEVSFYWNNDALIETVTAASGSTATTSSLSLSEATTYSWYAIISDGTDSLTDGTYSFETEYRPLVNTDYATNVDQNQFNANGDITDLGGTDVTERGFVYSTTSYADPGNISPADSSYGDSVSETPLQVGDSYGGGIIAYIYNDGSVLISQETDISTGTDWGCQGTELGASSNTDGYSNTQTIVNNCGDSGIAAKLCWNDNTNGYTDWYLPALDELEKLCANKNEIGNFQSAKYWSSTEGGKYGDIAYYVDFSDCSSYSGEKSTTHYVRCVRYESNPDFITEISTGTYSLTIDNLTEGTTYYHRAYAKNFLGYSYGVERVVKLTPIDIIKSRNSAPSPNTKGENSNTASDKSRGSASTPSKKSRNS